MISKVENKKSSESIRQSPLRSLNIDKFPKDSELITLIEFVKSICNDPLEFVQVGFETMELTIFISCIHLEHQN
jgi:hypothetical protein